MTKTVPRATKFWFFPPADSSNSLPFQLPASDGHFETDSERLLFGAVKAKLALMETEKPTGLSVPLM